MISSGVPQGSILGPLLFLLYVNDLPLKLTSESDMYADDVTIHCKGNNITMINCTLQDDLLRSQNWCMINNMAVNPDKTTCMTIGSRQKLKHSEDLNLFVNNSKIKHVATQKLLGIHIDKHLNWKAHVDITCSKLVSKLSLFRRIQYFLTPEMKIMFYNAYVTPIIDYGCVTWQNANTRDINRISKLQRRFLRVILRNDLNINDYDLSQKIQWLSFENRCKYFTCIIIYKSLHNLTPTYIDDLIKLVKNNNYNLRSISNNDLTHKTPHSNLLKKSFSYSGMEIWNHIPVSIRQSLTLTTFKHRLKKYFLFEAQNESHA